MDSGKNGVPVRIHVEKVEELEEENSLILIVGQQIKLSHNKSFVIMESAKECKNVAEAFYL